MTALRIGFFSFFITLSFAHATAPKELFKEIEPYSTHMLSVSPLHKLYIEELGNKNGVPILVMHGGPGVGASLKFRRLFDPKYYRIIIVDQRGNKRSTPLGELRENDTQSLVEDYEEVRKFLGIKEWHVSAGSWGTVLSILYAAKYPQYVKSLTLRGIFTANQDEFDHYFSSAMQKKYPKEWREFLKILDLKKTKLASNQYADKMLELLKSDSLEDKKKATKAFVYWDDTLSGKGGDLSFEPAEMDLISSLIYFHYETQNAFLKNEEVLAAAERIPAQIPVEIVNGDQDFLCPAWAAIRLHKRIKHSKLKIVKNGKHSIFNSPMLENVLEVFESYKK